jgi:hypothetical protein
MDNIIQSVNTGKGEVRIYSSGILHQRCVKGTELSEADSEREDWNLRKGISRELKLLDGKG